MLDEIINFSKELEQAGIYDRIQEQNKIIDKPILVIPVKGDLSDFDYDNIHVVVKDIIEEKGKNYIVLEKRKLNQLIDEKIEINNNSENILLKKINNLKDNKWCNILLSINNLTDKVFGSNWNIDRIGGISSYNYLIFLFLLNKNLQDIIKTTYINNKNTSEYLPESNKYIKNYKVKVINLLSKINCVKIKEIFEKLKKNFDLKKIKSINVIFKFNDYSIYNDIYNSFIEKRYKYNDIKIIENLYIPTIFNTNEISHIDRPINRNILINDEHCKYLYKFEAFFLKKLSYRLFPLFINNEYNQITINLFEKKNEYLIKPSFRKVIENIFVNTTNTELDFYLIIYTTKETQQDKKKTDILLIDYITGFKYNYKGKTVFEIETILNDYFFQNKLLDYYFDKPDFIDKNLNTLMLKYRTVIFDFIYRAKYNSLNKVLIKTLFIEVLNLMLKKAHKEDVKNYQYKDLMNNYLLLDKIFSKNEENFMKTIKEIKQNMMIPPKIESMEEFVYFSGQIISYILNQSKSETKTHALIEPFINVTSFDVFIYKFIELFNKYKHAINKNFYNFNQVTSNIFSYAHDNQKNIVIDNDFKVIFFAGYLDDNIFYKKDENKNLNKEGDK